MRRTEIPDSVYSIKPQGIDVEIPKPHTHVLHHKAADTDVPGIVVVDGLTPWCLILVRKIRAKGRQIVSFGTKMIVYDVQDNSYSVLVAGIHQPLQGSRASVAVLNGKTEYAVVTPVALPRELRNRHNFNRIDAQCFQIRKTFNNAIEVSLLGKRPDMQFVDDEIARVGRTEVVVCPIVAYVEDC